VTDCATVRDALLQGVVATDAGISEHLARCPQCRELLRANAELGRSLASEVSLQMPFPELSFEPLAQRLTRETGLRAWLRSRPSRQRFLAAALSALLAVGLGGALRPRLDFATYPRARLWLVLGVYTFLILAAFGKEIFLSVRRGAVSDYLALCSAALALPFALSLLPAAEMSRGFEAAGAFSCFAYGALLTLPTAALLFAFERADRISLRTVCLCAAALGLSSNLTLELHCPNGNRSHLLLGHASLGLAWLISWWVARRFTAFSRAGLHSDVRS
jgi:hypothetical protein